MKKLKNGRKKATNSVIDSDEPDAVESSICLDSDEYFVDGKAISETDQLGSHENSDGPLNHSDDVMPVSIVNFSMLGV